jgi:DNA-binding MarR family transcriptional regulator
LPNQRQRAGSDAPRKSEPLDAACVVDLDAHALLLEGSARQGQYRFDLALASLRSVRHPLPVSLSQIRYFVAVAEEKNVGKAARRLRIAQPPISRHIRSLEDELGATLFTRTPRGMELLPAGEVLLERARKILEAVDEAASATRSAARPAD